MQGKLEPVQRQEEDEEPMQGKLEPVQRQEEDEEPMQGKRETDLKQPVQPKINLAPSGSGKLMPEPVQQKMEGAFGADFSGVRIHEGPQAKAINAVAYTQGENIHFQPGKYQPDSQSGQELLGHELTHVVQQKAGRVTVPQGKGASINADPGLETEADILGAKAARGESVEVAGGSSTTIQRKWLGKNSQVLTAKNDISLKQSPSHSNIWYGQKLFKPESTNAPKQSSESAIQMKGGDIKKLDPNYVNIGFFRDSKTDIIYENINIYNEDIDVSDTNYEKQEKTLGKILENSRKWLTKYQDKKENFERIEAIREIYIDALREKAVVERQRTEAHPELRQKEGSVFTESLIGGETGNIGKIDQAAGIGSNVAGSIHVVAEGGSKALTGKGITDQPFVLEIIAKIKEFFGSAKESAKDVGEEAAQQAMGGSLDWIIGTLKDLGLPFLMLGLAIKNFYQAYRDKNALLDRKKSVQEKVKSGKQFEEGEEQLFKDIIYGFNKVKRRFYSAIYGVVDAGVELVSSALGFLVPGIGTAVVGAVTLGKSVLNGLKTLLVKSKGILKYLGGIRGKNRRESAERTVNLAKKGNQEALQLLVGFGFGENTEDMLSIIHEKTGDEYPVFINAVANKLKSQT
jgi:hypothetical protein